MEVFKSCGFLVIRGDPLREFLLMRHADRWDLPKGHVDADETDLACAYRELDEETGIRPADLDIVEEFVFTTHYPVRGRSDGQLHDKTLIIFLGRLIRDVPIQPTEHAGFQWFRWNPPHSIQPRTIDPLLAAVECFLSGQR